MTLVVVSAENGIVTFVADTKVTWDEDPFRTASVFEEALVKVVLLRDHLAVGIAGEYPDRVIRDLIQVREQPVDEVISALVADPRCDYLLADLEPLSIWRISDGNVEKCRPEVRSHIGDRDAFSQFQRLYDGWIASDPQEIKMRTAMDQLTSPLGTIPSVGGFATTVSGQDGQFVFREKEFYVAGRTSDDGYGGMQLPGTGSTPGASAIYIPEAGVGRVFTHEDPSTSVKLHASTPEAFAEGAQRDLSQSLVFWNPGAF